MGTSAVNGTVRDAATGAPLRGIALQLTGNNSSTSTQTGPKGAFTFGGLIPGTYTLLVPPGGEFAPNGRRVVVHPGVTVIDADLKLTKASTLSGRVLTDQRAPVSGAKVTLLLPTFVDGRRSFGSQSTRTNEQGSYRISGLLAGKYYVLVEPNVLEIRKRSPGQKNTGDYEPSTGLGRIYYPNSPTAETAVPVTVSSGEDRAGIDIVLRPQVTVCIGSAIADVPGLDRSATVAVALSELMPMSQSRIAFGRIGIGDEFEVCGVPRGAYAISASFIRENSYEYAFDTVSVGDRSMWLPALHLRPVQPIRGRVIVDEGGALGKAIRVVLHPKDRTMVAGESTIALVDPSGEFEIPATVLGDYWLRVVGLDRSQYIKSASIDGRDVWHNPLRPGHGDIEIAVGNKGPQLSGYVRDDDNQPVGDAVVMLAGMPLEDKTAPNEFLTTTSDETGLFSFASFPPGTYRLIALGGLTPGEVGSREVFSARAGESEEIVLSEGEVKSRSLVVKVVHNRGN